MSKRILITSALPYANGPLHFGHIAGAYLPADCYARFQRMCGADVLYICGSDEHGVAITLSADLANRSPKEHVDLYHEVIQDLFKKLSFSFDHYSRTTWSGHIETTQQFFADLLANGYIEDKITEQLYSPSEERFLADRYVVGTCPKCHFTEARGDECPRCGASYEATDLIEPRSKLTGSALILKPTKHWFLRFDLFKDRLTEWLSTKNWKPNVLKFAENYIKDLHPRAITRDGSWGIKVPIEGAEGKVFYVWFDAPIGYISATKEWAIKQGNEDAWRKYWLDPETHLVQFIGKDNIPFHAVFFPAMIMGQNIPYKLVDELPANEFYHLEGRPFSKSEGWYIDLESFFTHFTADQIRYAIAAGAPETQDSEFTWKDFQSRCNADLVGKLGNYANRILTFTQKQCDGKVPEPVDDPFLQEIEGMLHAIHDAYSHFRLRKAMQLIMELAHKANAYFDSNKPWMLAKKPETIAEMRHIIYCCLECLRTLATAIYPVMPNAATTIWSFLGYSTPLSQWVSSPLPEGQLLPIPSLVFQRVEDEHIIQAKST